MSDALRMVAVLGLVTANAFFVVGKYAIVTRGAAGWRPQPRLVAREVAPR